MSFDDPAFKPWIELYGRLHPTLVHFPIALLLVAVLFEFARRRFRERAPATFALWCLGIGAGMAAITATSGWARAATEPFGGDLKQTLFMHRWGGVSVASIAILALIFGLVARGGAMWARVPYRAGLLTLALLVPGVGHLGGTLVYGANWFTEPFTRGDAVDPEATPPTPQAPTALTSIDFETQIAPIFAQSCVECHGPKKQKAGLAFEPIAKAFKGDPNDWPIKPGNASASALIHRVSLPQGDEDAMPPGERARLTPQQIAMLSTWIDAGAPHPGAPPDQAEGGTSAAESTAPSADAIGARDASLGTLVARGAYAARIAADSNEVEVNLSLLGAQVVDADLAQLHGLEPFLVSLDLSRTGVTDAVAPQLAGFTRLERLRLDHTAIGDAVLPVLKLMPNLAYLNLVETKVTNAAIPLLGDLRALQKLYVWQSALTSDGVAALRQTRPQLEVVFGEIPVAAAAETASAPPAPAPAPTTAVPPPAKEKHCPCCDKATAEGKICDHPCCVQAAKDGHMCETCAVDKP